MTCETSATKPRSERERGTHGLLDDLASHLALQELGVLVALEDLARNNLVRHRRDSRIDVRRPVPNIEIDLVRALEISPERGVVLQSVASPVLMNRERALVLDRVGRTKGVGDLEAGRETLPGILGLEPPALAL